MLLVFGWKSWRNPEKMPRSCQNSQTIDQCTCSSHVFTNFVSTNLQIFSRNFRFHFLEGWKVSFFVMITSYIGIFYLNRKLLPCWKIKQRKFCEKNRRFRNRENMWWAWPRSKSSVLSSSITLNAKIINPDLGLEPRLDSNSRKK